MDTTLLVYFFGRRGNDQLRFEDFQPFVENLQTEVLQMEYHEFSKGADTITELDFARILLRSVFYLNSSTVTLYSYNYNKPNDFVLTGTPS